MQYIRKIFPNAVEFIDSVICSEPNLGSGCEKVKILCILEYEEEELEVELAWYRAVVLGSHRGLGALQFTIYGVKTQPFCWSQKLGKNICLLLAWHFHLHCYSVYENILQDSPIKGIHTSCPTEDLIPNV